jgi:hypothetical protein
MVAHFPKPDVMMEIYFFPLSTQFLTASRVILAGTQIR